MYGREKRVLLREYLEQGLTKTALAVKLGLSRRTIHHWIETGQLDRDLDNEAVRYKKRPSTPRKNRPVLWDYPFAPGSVSRVERGARSASTAS